MPASIATGIATTIDDVSASLAQLSSSITPRP